MNYRNPPPFDTDPYAKDASTKSKMRPVQESFLIAALPILIFLAILGVTAFLHAF
jgi:hypothetical protein